MTDAKAKTAVPAKTPGSEGVDQNGGKVRTMPGYGPAACGNLGNLGNSGYVLCKLRYSVHQLHAAVTCIYAEYASTRQPEI